jgi:hypothetical protein
MTAADVTPTEENTTEVDELADRWERYKLAKKAEAAGKKAADEARADIVELMKARGAEFGTIGGQLVCRWRRITKRKFQQAKFVESNPELAEQYYVESDEWRLEQVK